jgi:hypothetical protein
MKDSTDVYVTVLGLGISVPVNKDGSFAIHHLPEGVLRLQFFVYKKGDTVAHMYEIVRMESKAGQTVTIDSFIESPAITKKLDSLISIHPGETCTLSITASGKPEPIYYWYKDTSFLNSDSTGRYIIHNAIEADSGLYWCKVVNQWGSVISGQIHLIVASISNLPPRLSSIKLSIGDIRLLRYRSLRNGLN